MRKIQFPVQYIAISGAYYEGKRVAPDLEKVKAISKLFDAIDINILHSFLGCCNYYVCFIHRYGHIRAPLMDLLCTGA